ncbi:MAG: T9SS type A sorting domain-containing protein [Bacteroidales bacterium]|nr:T9SS type A sorting domain-containing protein [Bacteroidales bacterium]
MNTKKIFLGIILLMAGYVLAAQDMHMVVSADGSETAYELTAMQKIVFENNAMTVNMKSTNPVTGATVIHFKEGSVPPITGIETAPKPALLVFPNPVKSNLSISGVAARQTMNVYNSNGTLVQSVQTYEGETTVNVTDLQQGIYFLHVGKQVVKFIKQ